MRRLFGSQLQCWLLVSHFSPVIPELLLSNPDLRYPSSTKVSAPLHLLSPHRSLPAPSTAYRWLLMSELL